MCDRSLLYLQLACAAVHTHVHLQGSQTSFLLLSMCSGEPELWVYCQQQRLAHPQSLHLHLSCFCPLVIVFSAWSLTCSCEKMQAGQLRGILHVRVAHLTVRHCRLQLMPDVAATTCLPEGIDIILLLVISLLVVPLCVIACLLLSLFASHTWLQYTPRLIALVLCCFALLRIKKLL